ncbi:MAG: type I DNA topoisomerase [Candidatus Omnitrophica bacterium]|jgi:DNA topoisomerase-1|nr:type I DNA topoisomerase [Candidatus Omnitrophota bacterium]MDD5079329.1 type I DNA topoisomerase [Candidatus Omnitrophota bacterium]
MASKKLVIVESPTKAKTISRILGKGYEVVSSMGHLIDLPKKELGVDIEKDFEPSYVVIFGRKKLVTQLKKEGGQSDVVYIATDPDREGEAIGWHLQDKLFKGKEVYRVNFHEITPAAVKNAFDHPRPFDHNMVQAQVSRRILDRIVGYFLSPLLWKKIARGLSAGRVQSVALRLIVEREKQIKEFIPKEYWEIEAELSKKGSSAVFTAKLDKIEGQKAQINNKEQAEELAGLINTGSFTVKEIKTTEKKRYADPPFITSTLQQEGFNKLKFNATRTMILAQQLYEGIDIGEEAPVGLITYMRTDSTNVAKEAIAQVRSLIAGSFGRDYLPDSPPVYKTKKFAQEAHEAIRPTLIDRKPESLKNYLNAEQYELYELIYNRFVASQMSPARYMATSVAIENGKFIFNASGSASVFDGFSVLYNKNGQDQEKNNIPSLEKDEILALLKLEPSQHFTKPPARFSDSSLVKIMEEEGIGRPSTYAPIISTLILRGYVHRMRGYLHPTELGFKVCDMLIQYFPEIMDVKFTAYMEGELDDVEEGKIARGKVLLDFYTPFKASFDFAQDNIKKEVVTTDEICDKCGKPMIIKWGRKGKFLSCSDFPACKNAKSITSGVKCPQPECGGELVQRRSKRGFFYGCTNYPKCTFIAKELPEEKE